MPHHPTHTMMVLTLTTAVFLLQSPSPSQSHPLPRITRQLDSLICTTNADCSRNEVCTQTIGDECSDGTPCFCLAKGLVPEFRKCEQDRDCESNACLFGVCLPPLEINIPGLNFSTDPDGGIRLNDPADKDKHSNSDAEAGVCIAVHLLKHFQMNNLVFDTHRHAHVLCDRFRSCATPGHIVEWAGRPMMMKTYCKHVHGGCTRQLMLVNSPRYAAQLRVQSLSPHLSFTALAARFESLAEELLLTTAVRMGM